MWFDLPGEATIHPIYANSSVKAPPDIMSYQDALDAAIPQAVLLPTASVELDCNTMFDPVLLIHPRFGPAVGANECSPLSVRLPV